MLTTSALHHMQAVILERLPIGVVAATIKDQRLLYANAAFLAKTGYQLDELPQLTPVDLHFPIDHDAVVRDFVAMARGELHCPVYYPVLCKDGSSFSAEIQLVATDSQATGIVVATFQDITPRENAKLLQYESEERLRLALSATKQGLYDLDIPSGKAEVSDEYVTMIGYDPADFIETNAAWRERLHPDDVDRVYQTYVDYVQGRISEYRVEFRQRTKAGQWKWTLSLGEIVSWTENGLPKRMLGTHTDIDHAKQLETELSNERTFLKSLLQNIPDLVWLKDPAGLYLACNRRFEHLYGVSEAELIGRGDVQFVDESTAQFFRHHDLNALASATPLVNEEWLEFKHDGHRELVETTKVRLTTPAGEVLGVLGIAHNITERVEHAEQLKLAASVFSSAIEGIMITNPHGIILDVNESFTRITGYTKQQAVGQNAGLLNSGRQSRSFYRHLWRDLLQKGQWAGEIWNRRANGEIYAELLHISSTRDEQGQISHFVAVFSDISTLKAQQQQLELIAHFDPLTGLPNRVLLVDRLRQALQQSRRSLKTLAVVFLDLDGFKIINDQFGHQVGDQVLVTIANRFREALRGGDTIARIGGDEFIAVLPELTDAQASLIVLERLLDAAATPFVVEEIELQVSASLGVTFALMASDSDADLLIRQADQAMYQAKLAGKNRFHVFDPKNDNDARHRFELLNEIRTAIDQDQFTLYYQPKVALRTGEVIGFEALIRWQHPVRGLLSPIEFIPLVAQHPLAISLGDWVIAEALSQLHDWNQQGFRTVISVNMDSQQLNDLDFLRRLHDVLELFPNVHPTQLELEVLETGALDNLQHVSQLIRQLQHEGIYCALDDFGTGYSSLTFLKQLPARTIKIDQSFVRQMLEDAQQLVIVESVISLAQRFERHVIAEGVESLLHGVFLSALGCQQAQGYGIARPMPAEQVLSWVSAWQAPACWSLVPLLDADGMQGLIALIEHHQWYQAVKRGAPQESHNHFGESCRLDHWLNREQVQQKFRDCALYQQARKTHNQLHQALATLDQLRADSLSLALQQQLLRLLCGDVIDCLQQSSLQLGRLEWPLECEPVANGLHDSGAGRA